MASKANDGTRIRIQTEALDVGKDEEGPLLAAYAFGSSGRLLDRAEVRGSEPATLTVPGSKEPEDVRILVGPRLDADGPQLLSDLIRVGAEERMVRPTELADRISLPLDRAQWLCWLRRCTVRGTLMKRETSGGMPLQLPVCGAEVEVYEVDPFPLVFGRIPDELLERLRQVVRKPVPDPDPGPFLIPDGPVAQGLTTIFEAVTKADAGFADLGGGGDEEPGTERAFRFSGAERTRVGREEAVEALRSITDEPALVRAANVSAPAFRDALLAHPLVVRPFLCLVWPLVTMRLVATATTDECGRFRTAFHPGCSSDVPDLYFKAFGRIGPFRVPIYAPAPVPCYTWWNYTCGSDVHLLTTSPFAHVCPPCQPVIAPDHWVLAMAVGNTSLASLRGTSSALAPTTGPGNIGLTGGGEPWGGYLRFRFEFDHTLRTDLNVRYYRISWRKAGSGNPFVPLNDTQLRHYIHQVGPMFPIDPYVLGPQTVGGTPNLFEMPPARPPVGQWVIANAVTDTTSAAFASATMAPPAESGQYDFKLDLFDGAGAQVSATALGISYRVPTTTDVSATIPTEDAGALGLVTAAGSLVFRLHIDNNSCAGSIGAATLGTQTAGSECGVLEYGATSASLDLPFTASHPNGFAQYSFRVVKGLAAVLTDGGPVGALPGAHSLAPTVASLLGPCTTAGFAEDLHVAATATDGWSRQSQYDANPLPRPFVLTPPA